MRITIDEALARGYTHTRIGWNHREGKPVLAPIRRVRSLNIAGNYDLGKLDAVRALMAGSPESEPAADIPMVSR